MLLDQGEKSRRGGWRPCAASTFISNLTVNSPEPFVGVRSDDMIRSQMFEEVGNWNFGDDGLIREPGSHREGERMLPDRNQWGSLCYSQRNQIPNRNPWHREVLSTVRSTVCLGTVKAGGILVIHAGASMGCWKKIQAACKRYKDPCFYGVSRRFVRFLPHSDNWSFTLFASLSITSLHEFQFMRSNRRRTTHPLSDSRLVAMTTSC